MLLQKDKNDIRLSNNLNGKVQQFKIAVNKKSFEILFGKLYSNRHLAIVRELAANAYDSHIAAKREKTQFKIHLPNKLDPIFYIEDYGTGIPEQQIYDLYTVLFNSSRSDSNDYIGCLGLGSKTPYSYTDQFSVESRCEGKKKTYCCFINPEGIPSVVKIDEVDSDQPEGLTVSFAVADKDFDNFAVATQTLRYFKPLPKVVGRTFEFNKVKYIYDEPTFGVHHQENQYSTAQSYLIMGGVPYAIKTHQFDYGTKRTLLNEIGVDIYANIGEVDITASREELEYTDRTKEFISQKLEEIAILIEKRIGEDIANASTHWEANIQYTKHNVQFSKIHKISDNILWKGKKVYNRSVNTYQFKNCPEVYTLDRTKRAKLKKSSGVPCKDDVDIILDDEHNLRRIRHYQDNTSNSVYIIRTDSYERQGDAYDNYPDFLKESGVKDIIKYSSRLPDPPPRPPSERKPREKDPVINILSYRNGSGYRSRPQSYWENKQLKLSEIKNCLYVFTHRFKVLGRSLSEEYSFYEKFDVVNKEIIGVTKTEYKRLKNLNLEYFWDYYDKFINKLNVKGLEIAKGFAEFQSNYNLSALVKKTYCKGSTFAQFIKIYNAFKLTHSKYNKQMFLCNRTSRKLEQVWKGVLEQYPMLDIVKSYLYKDEVYDYIMMVDKCNK